jgi:virulence-associated protein VagC
VDFRGGDGVRTYLKGFLTETRGVPTPASNTWDELTALADRVSERSLTERIEQDLRRILADTHL